MFLGGQHEDGEYQHGGQEHLDEDAPNYRCVLVQGRSNCERAREHGMYDRSSRDTTDELGDDEQ